MPFCAVAVVSVRGEVVALAAPPQRLPKERAQAAAECAARAFAASPTVRGGPLAALAALASPPPLAASAVHAMGDLFAVFAPVPASFSAAAVAALSAARGADAAATPAAATSAGLPGDAAAGGLWAGPADAAAIAVAVIFRPPLCAASAAVAGGVAAAATSLALVAAGDARRSLPLALLLEEISFRPLRGGAAAADIAEICAAVAARAPLQPCASPALSLAELRSGGGGGASARSGAGQKTAGPLSAAERARRAARGVAAALASQRRPRLLLAEAAFAFADDGVRDDVPAAVGRFFVAPATTPTLTPVPTPAPSPTRAAAPPAAPTAFAAPAPPIAIFVPAAEPPQLAPLPPFLAPSGPAGAAPPDPFSDLCSPMSPLAGAATAAPSPNGLLARRLHGRAAPPSSDTSHDESVFSSMNFSGSTDQPHSAQKLSGTNDSAYAASTGPAHVSVAPMPVTATQAPAPAAASAGRSNSGGHGGAAGAAASAPLVAAGAPVTFEAAVVETVQLSVCSCAEGAEGADNSLGATERQSAIGSVVVRCANTAVAVFAAPKAGAPPGAFIGAVPLACRVCGPALAAAEADTGGGGDDAAIAVWEDSHPGGAGRAWGCRFTAHCYLRSLLRPAGTAVTDDGDGQCRNEQGDDDDDSDRFPVVRFLVATDGPAAADLALLRCAVRWEAANGSDNEEEGAGCAESELHTAKVFWEFAAGGSTAGGAALPFAALAGARIAVSVPSGALLAAPRAVPPFDATATVDGGDGDGSSGSAAAAAAAEGAQLQCVWNLLPQEDEDDNDGNGDNDAVPPLLAAQFSIRRGATFPRVVSAAFAGRCADGAAASPSGTSVVFEACPGAPLVGPVPVAYMLQSGAVYEFVEST